MKINHLYKILIIWQCLLCYVATCIAQMPLLKVQTGHPNGIQSVAFSPSGEYVLTCSRGSVAKLWNSRGREVRSFAPKPTLSATSLGGKINLESAYFIDNERVILMGMDYGAMGLYCFIFELATAKELARFPKGITSVPNSVSSFSQNGLFITGDMMMYGKNDGKAKVYNMQGQLAGQLGNPTINSGAAISPNGKNIVVIGQNNQLEIYDQSYAFVRSFKPQSRVGAIVFSADNERFMAGAEVYEVQKGWLFSIPEKATSYCFSPNGQYLLTGNAQGIAKLWDKNGKLIKEIQDNAGNSWHFGINAVCFSPDSQTFVVGQAGGWATQWTMEGIRVRYFEGFASPIKQVTCLPDGERLVFGADDGYLRIWSYKNIHDKNALKSFYYGAKITTFDISQDGKLVAVGGECEEMRGGNCASGKIKVWNVDAPSDAEPLAILEGTRGDSNPIGTMLSGVNGIGCLRFAPDNKTLWNTSEDKITKVWDTETGQLVQRIANENFEDYSINAFEFTPDKKGFWVSNGRSGRFSFRNEQFKTIQNIGIQDVTSFSISPDGKFLVYSTGYLFKDLLGIMPATGNTQGTGKSITLAGVMTIAFAPDSQTFAVAGRDRKIRLFDTQLKLLHTFDNAHEDDINTLYFSPNNRFLFSGSEDATIRMWNLTQKKAVATLIPQIYGSPEFVILQPDGYYACTPQGTNAVHYIFQSKIYDFDQFDIQYNRPDKLLATLESKDKELIEIYAKAQQRRLSKMQIDSTKFSKIRSFQFPEVTLHKKATFYEQTNQKTYQFAISASDKTQQLKAIRVAVNGVPIKGSNYYKQLTNTQKLSQEKIQIDLAEGNNLVEVSVINDLGLTSLKEKFEVYYQPTKNILPNLYVLVAAVGDYQNRYDATKKDWNLRYPLIDAQQIAKTFKATQKLYNKVYIDSLFNSNFTQINLQKWANILKNTQPQDVVVIFYAGHGILDNQLDYFLATSQVNFDKPQTFSQQAVAYQQFIQILDGIPARQKIVLIDACHAGELDKEDKAEADKAALAGGSIKPPKFGKKTTQDNATAPNNTPKFSRYAGKTFEKMKALFSDLRDNYGETIIAAAGAMQFAQESNEWGNGVFSYCIANLLQGKEIPALKELQANFLTPEAPITLANLIYFIENAVKKLTDNAQEPNARVRNYYNDQFRLK